MSNNLASNSFLLPPNSTTLKTLVLDLDETLVHSQFTPFSIPSDIVIKIEIENEIQDVHALIRPGVKNLLEKMKNIYEIIVFTASVSKYANPLLNIIDTKNICVFRLFREHCTIINTSFVKDLQRLGRELKNVVIVDNSPLSYIFHPNNGLPIQAWFEDKNDKELYKIIPILEFLSGVDDVRNFIPKIVEDNEINYGKAFEIISKYKKRKINAEMKIYLENEKNNNENINNNDILLFHDKLVKLAKKNIIASVNNNNFENIYKTENNSRTKNSINNNKFNQSINGKIKSITKKNTAKPNNKIKIISIRSYNSEKMANKFYHINYSRKLLTKSTDALKRKKSTPKTQQIENNFFNNSNRNIKKKSIDKITKKLTKSNLKKIDTSINSQFSLPFNCSKNRNRFKCFSSYSNNNTSSNIYHKKQKSYNYYISYANMIKKLPNNKKTTPKNNTKKKFTLTTSHVQHKSINCSNKNNNSFNFYYFKTNRNKIKRDALKNKYEINKTLDNKKYSFKTSNLLSNSTVIEMNKTHKIFRFELSEVVHKRGITGINGIKNELSFMKGIITRKGGIDKIVRHTSNKSQM